VLIADAGRRRDTSPSTSSSPARRVPASGPDAGASETRPP